MMYFETYVASNIHNVKTERQKFKYLDLKNHITNLEKEHYMAICTE